MKKRILPILLLAAILVSTAGCAKNPEESGQSETNEPEQSDTSEPIRISDLQMKEIEKAISLGIVPDEIQGDYTSGITFAQYTKMITSLINIWDDSVLPEWEKITEKAAASNDNMRREDGILELSYALVLLGEGEPSDFGNSDIDQVCDTIDRSAEPSWDYPLFPDWEEKGFPWCESNYMQGGWFTCAVRQSLVSEQPIYPLVTDGPEDYLQNPLSRGDAISAVLRMAELDPTVLEPEGRYCSIDEISAYDKSIITESLLNASTVLPEPTQEALPAEWKGMGISSRKDGKHVYRDFSEADIAFLAENGFNFARIFFGFSTLRFPDYPDDPYLVNENELRDLDQLIAWGIEYGVHIQIAMDFAPNDKETLDCDEEEWGLIRSYWQGLTKRYAGISSRYLTFDLANELAPSEDNIEYAAQQMADIVGGMRERDPNRVLLFSFPGNPNAEWMNKIAALGVAIGCHPYFPQYITTSDWEYAERNPYARPVWPLPWFPMGEISEGRAILTLTGELSGATLQLHVEKSEPGAVLEVHTDGNLLQTIPLEGGEVDENNEVQYDDELFLVQLPEGTVQAEVRVTKPHAFIDTILVDGNAGQTVIVPYDACDNPAFGETPLQLVIQEDGSYVNSENTWISGDEIYQYDILPYQQIAQKYGVGFMVNEFGIFGSNLDWEIGIVADYHDSALQMLTEKKIGWCGCELYNGVPKHIVLLYGAAPQWSGATVETHHVTTHQGETCDLRVVQELLDVFLKYTK